MLCFTASPPLTVLSLMTYLTPASTSNRIPSMTSSITDLNPLAPVPCSSALYQHLQLDGELESKYQATMKQVEP